MTVTEHPLQVGSSPRQRCIVLNADAMKREHLNFNLVGVVHGGFWRAEKTPESVLPMAHGIAELGIPSACLGYRTVEDGAGLHEMLADLSAGIEAAAAACAINEPARLLIVGHSAGGHLALHLCDTRADVTAVALAPISLFERETDLCLGESGVRALYANTASTRRADPSVAAIEDAVGLGRALRARTAAPVVIVHGLDDQTVPVEMSQRYALRGRNPVQLHLVPGARHMDLVKPDRAAGQYVIRLLANRIAPRPR